MDGNRDRFGRGGVRVCVCVCVGESVCMGGGGEGLCVVCVGGGVGGGGVGGMGDGGRQVSTTLGKGRKERRWRGVRVLALESPS